jgi:hypothetical protein
MNVRMPPRSDHTVRRTDEHPEFLFDTNDFTEMLQAYSVELTRWQIPSIRDYGLVTMNNTRNRGTERRTLPSPVGGYLAI